MVAMAEDIDIMATAIETSVGEHPPKLWSNPWHPTVAQDLSFPAARSTTIVSLDGV
jgi:hypothetical protein